MLNEPIKIEDKLKEYFTLKPGMNYMNKANDWKNHITEGGTGASIIASGKLDDESIEEMFKHGYKKSFNSETAGIQDLMKEYLALEIEDMPRFMKRLVTIKEAADEMNITKSLTGDPFGDALMYDFEAYAINRYNKATENKKGFLHHIGQHIKAFGRHLAGTIQGTDKTHLSELMHTLTDKNYSPHTEAHLANVLKGFIHMKGTYDVGVKSQAKKAKKAEKTKAPKATKASKVPKVPASRGPGSTMKDVAISAKKLKANAGGTVTHRGEDYKVSNTGKSYSKVSSDMGSFEQIIADGIFGPGTPGVGNISTYTSEG